LNIAQPIVLSVDLGQVAAAVLATLRILRFLRNAVDEEVGRTASFAGVVDM
jgi:hypothetical protein